VVILHYGTIWVLGVSLFFWLNSRRGWGAMSLLVMALINFMLAYFESEISVIKNWLSSVLILIVLLGATKYKKSISSRVAKMANFTYTLYLFHFLLMLFFYALIRDIYDISPISYFALAFVFTLGLLPLSQFFGRFLEDRRRWEALLYGLKFC
jgi:membrane-bound acyltransferase YfiQ involved in biofilm formation